MENFTKEYLQAVCQAQISPMEVFMKQQEDATHYYVIDVRIGPAEFRQNKIIGAQELPLNELGPALGTLPRDKKILVYTWGVECTLGKAALLMLSEAGLDTVELGGGIAAWKNANLPTEPVA